MCAGCFVTHGEGITCRCYCHHPPRVPLEIRFRRSLGRRRKWISTFGSLLGQTPGEIEFSVLRTIGDMARRGVTRRDEA